MAECGKSNITRGRVVDLRTSKLQKYQEPAHSDVGLLKEDTNKTAFAEVLGTSLYHGPPKLIRLQSKQP